MKKTISKVVVTWFGSGLFPKVPGTIGSLASIPFVVFFAYNYGFCGVALFCLFICIIGFWSIHEFTKDFAEKDQQIIVIDETIGIFVTFAFVSKHLYQNTSAWWVYLLGFLLFRYFDIHKVLLVKYFDSKNTKSGVILDDVFAGIYAGVVLYIILKITQYL